MKKLKVYWNKLSLLNKSKIISIFIFFISYTLFVLDVYYSIIPYQLEFIFAPMIPIVLLGTVGCGWSSFNGGGIFGSLCDASYSQIIFFLVISITLGYLVGALVGSIINKINEKFK